MRARTGKKNARVRTVVDLGMRAKEFSKWTRRSTYMRWIIVSHSRCGQFVLNAFLTRALSLSLVRIEFPHLTCRPRGGPMSVRKMVKNFTNSYRTWER